LFVILIKEQRITGSTGSVSKLSLLATLMVLFLLSPARSQVNPAEVAPPPLRAVSKEEQSLLEKQSGVRKRTETALELMGQRLKMAETLVGQQKFDQVFLELGRFHGLMENTLTYLDGSDRDNNRVLNNYKRFEIGLRLFRPRLEVIRRSIPLSYEPYVRNLIDYLRDARSRAVEPLFSDTILPRTKP
jgi:hypothetical protein